MTAPKPIAVSYVRFSHPDQARGDSLRRQVQGAEDWCKRNGVTLDTTTTLRDLGKSAFAKPKEVQEDSMAAVMELEDLVNPDRRALTAFFQLIKNRKVPRGAY